MTPYDISLLLRQGKFRQELRFAWIPTKCKDGSTIWFDEYLEFFQLDTKKSLGNYSFDFWDSVVGILHADHHNPNPDAKKKSLKAKMSALFDFCIK